MNLVIQKDKRKKLTDIGLGFSLDLDNNLLDGCFLDTGWIDYLSINF